MSQLIHMDTEIVSKLASQLNQYSAILAEKAESVKSLMSSISWEGGSRDDHFNQVNAVLMKILGGRNEAELINQKLCEEINQWIQVDDNFKQAIPLVNNSEDNSLQSKGILGQLIALYGFTLDKDIDDTFEFYATDSRGQELLDACKDANLRFAYIDDYGNIISSFGAEDGEIVYIQWVEPSEIPGANGSYDSGPPAVIKMNNELKDATAYETRNTLAHEIQHAIDDKTLFYDSDLADQSFMELENMEFSSLSQDNIDQINWDSLENGFETSLTEYVHTEIRAHSRGYEFKPLNQVGEKVLNMDNIFTPEEYKVILNDRDYASHYQNYIEEKFLERGLDATINVYWDDSYECIQVDVIEAKKI